MRPLPRRLTAEELVDRHRNMPPVDPNLLRRDADEFFGGEDRVGRTDPWERGCG
jgi:hypothetical protein